MTKHPANHALDSVHKVDFKSDAFFDNPEETFGKLRAQGAVVRVKLPFIGKVWLTTTHAAAAAMLKDNKRFSMRKPGVKGVDGIAGLRWWMPRTFRLLGNNMLTSDDPDHRRLRGLVDQAFQRRAVRDLENSVALRARVLLDKVGKGSEPFDLIETYARRLPLDVISDLLGLDARAKHQFVDHAGRVSGVTGLVGLLRMFPALNKMTKLLRETIQRERERLAKGEESNGLLSDLVLAELEGARLSDDELLAMIFLLLFAGHETTTHMIATSVMALDKHPDQRRAFMESDDNGLAVEELLRFNSPVQFSKPRHVTSDGGFFGRELRKGDIIIPCIAAANYDPATFDDPQTLNLTRKPNPHLEFGTGIHFCLGFQLARLEVDVALSELYRMYPKMQVKDATWRKSFGMRAVGRLMVG